ncbi:replicative protein [Bivalve RNA virus G1]|uniref:replicative protein n=1 Tax=Bivalve RNA virus G1 TaxID=1926967 RepID=UPI00092DB3D6|nr:replicative protein [Bivalve RNA virus G1]APJ38004.1 replicative protein [Bivalve RNA virus G1]
MMSSLIDETCWFSLALPDLVDDTEDFILHSIMAELENLKFRHYEPTSTLLERSLLKFFSIALKTVSFETVDVMLDELRKRLPYHRVPTRYNDLLCLCLLVRYPITPTNLRRNTDHLMHEVICTLTCNFGEFRFRMDYYSEMELFEFSVRWKDPMLEIPDHIPFFKMNALLEGSHNETLQESHLLLSGDVETNPGPVHSKMLPPEEEMERLRTRIKELERVLKSYRNKDINAENYSQRQFELQKRDYKRRRKANRQQKFEAQGLLNFCSNIGSTAQRLPGAIDSIGMAFNTITESLESFKSVFEDTSAVDMVSIVLCLVGIAKSISSGNLMYTTIHSVLLARNLNITLSDLMTLLPSRTDTANEVRFQREEEEEFVAESLVDDLLASAGGINDLYPVTSFLAFVTGVLSLCCSGIMPTPAAMTKHFTSIGRASLGFKTVRDTFDWLSNYLTEVYYKKVHNMSKEEFEYLSLCPRLAQLQAAVTIIAEMNYKYIANSEKIANHVLALDRELGALRSQAIQQKNLQCQKYLESLRLQVSEQVKHARSSPALQYSSRLEPYALYMHGEPGVGKTILTKILICKLYDRYLKNSGLALDLAAHWRMGSCSEFWEGYSGQPILVLDDYGNMVDSPQNPNHEFKDLQGIVSGCPFSLNMAEAHNKGKFYFTSRYVLASANAQTPDIKSMIDPSSILRRFGMYVTVSIDPAYGKPLGIDATGKQYYKYDPATAADSLHKSTSELEALAMEHYRISLYDVVPDKSQGTVDCRAVSGTKIMTINEFFDYYTEKMDAHFEYQEKLNSEWRSLAGAAPLEHLADLEEKQTQLDRCFNEERFLRDLSDTPELSEKMDESEDWTPFGDAYRAARTRLQSFRDRFSSLCSAFNDKLTKSFAKCVEVSKNALHACASFILACFSGATNALWKYLPTSKVLVGGLATGGLILYFLGEFFSKSSPCNFISNPSKQLSPCRKCPACELVDFPTYGDMLMYYMEKLSSHQVISSLESMKVNVSKLMSRVMQIVTSSARVDMYSVTRYQLPLAQAQEWDANTPTPPMAQSKSWEHARRAPPPRPVAQNGNVNAKCDIIQGSSFTAEGDVTRVQQVTHTLLKNSMWVECVSDKDVSSANGTFIQGRVMLTTGHTCLQQYNDNPYHTIRLTNPFGTTPSMEVKYSECRIYQMVKADGSPLDLALICFPTAINCRGTILSKFISAKDLSFVGEGSLVMTVFHMMGGRTVVKESYPSNFRVHTKPIEYNHHSAASCPGKTGKCTHQLRISNSIVYESDTEPGMCGGLLSICNRLINNKILGIHVAGGGGAKALGAVVTRELLDANLAKFIHHAHIRASDLIDGRDAGTTAQGLYTIREEVPSLVQKGDCVMVGTARAPPMATKTQLRPSAIHGEVIAPISKPAHLTSCLVDGERINVMEKGIMKVMESRPYLDPDILEIAANDVFAGFRKNHDRGIVHTLAEAICGVDGDPYKRPINRTTSAGYPFNTMTLKKGKTEWLGEGDTYVTDHPVVVEYVNNLIQDSKRGIRSPVVSMSTLKDEKRPLYKVDAGKTRIFQACPMHFVLVMRMYFLDFAAHVMSTRIDNGCAVGINPYSLEWTALAHHLLEKGDNMVAGDFTNFDGSLHYQILHKICEKINDWYDDGEENALLRFTLWEHIASAEILVGKEVVRLTHSQPSGNPLTVIINSIFNAIVMRMAYLMLKQEQGMSLTCDYTDHVSEITYGDDDIKSVSHSVLSWFNQQSITRVLKSLGLTYTDEQKSESEFLSKPLNETSFLKRDFVEQSDGTYLGPMPVENILDMTNWVKGKAIIAATAENCRAALMELGLHPKPVYDKWSDVIKRACIRHGVPLRVPTYVEQRDEYRVNSLHYAEREYVPNW